MKPRGWEYRVSTLQDNSYIRRPDCCKMKGGNCSPSDEGSPEASVLAELALPYASVLDKDFLVGGERRFSQSVA